MNLWKYLCFIQLVFIVICTDWDKATGLAAAAWLFWYDVKAAGLFVLGVFS